MALPISNHHVNFHAEHGQENMSFAFALQELRREGNTEQQGRLGITGI